MSLLNPLPVNAPRQHLSARITRMLILFFLAAVAAIGGTLLVSWQLEGGAAAINDAGSQRMRMFKLALLLDNNAPAEDIQMEIDRADRIFLSLKEGDPQRAVPPPAEKSVAAGVVVITTTWQLAGRPLIESYLSAQDPETRRIASKAYLMWARGFVTQIDSVVSQMEHVYTFNTNLLRTVQIALLALAFIGTLLLIRFFFVMVIRPVDTLYEGIRRMAGGDFSTRLKSHADDEFGVLTEGYNHMAQHLEQLYGRLEERVAEKTSSLASRNAELGLLYEVTSFLNEPAEINVLCTGFLERVKASAKATAGSIRLRSPDGQIHLTTTDSLSENFVACERALREGECACGATVASGVPLVADTATPPSIMVRESCMREGFKSVTAFPIKQHRETLGVFNLYFDHLRAFDEAEISLYETLGRHLGVAIENQRLRSRERETAITQERHLLAQELHDSIAQGLAFLNIQCQLLHDSLRANAADEALDIAGRIREGIQESYDDVRELLVHFRTRVTHADLDAAILAAIERFEKQTGLRTDFDRSGSSIYLEGDETLQILHIVQEALSNIRKHARATRVRIGIEHDQQGMTIQICDDGVGFDPEVSIDESHVGLSIMKERAARVGAECQVQSAPGKGTCVLIKLQVQVGAGKVGRIAGKVGKPLNEVRIRLERRS